MSEQGADARQFEIQARLTKDAAMIGEWTSETTATLDTSTLPLGD